ncbi:nuclear transport factor 2 family protein [Roseobacter sp. EG26]|uniref:nuclear transport factor 2 family protein n=1 Tax=Roseobacter sp. EG26 TaxID=3412477 RepID=UPI003CE5A2AC
MSFSQATLDELATRYTAAWNSRIPEEVAACHAPNSQIVINRGDPSVGHTGLAEMAAGFHADVPDLLLTSGGIRAAGNHVIFIWTFTGHHAETGNPLDVSGWEEWELDESLKITSSQGWFDAEDYQMQVDGSAG